MELLLHTAALFALGFTVLGIYRLKYYLRHYLSR